MVPGGITEIIWHFAGYLKIFDDIARFRITPDEGDYRSDTNDYTSHPSQFALTPADDVTDSRPVAFQDAPAAGESDHHTPRSHLSSASAIDIDRFAPSYSHVVMAPISPGSGGGGGDVIKAIYQEGGEQSEIQTHQYNNMYDDDAVTGTHSANALAALNNLEVEADHAIATMVAGAGSVVPAEWHAPHDTASLPAFVAAHDQAWAAHDGTADPYSVKPGYYLNGVLQDPAAIAPDQVPAPAPDLGHGLGQWTLDGGNTAANGAYIVDLTDSARTMVVMGDYFKTNAVFQTNSYMDNDHVTVGGTAASITTGGDQATNIADFVQHPGAYDSLPSYFAGPNWSVDVVQGDYFNVHALVQSNYLSDNDVTMQSSSSTHYEIHAGQNELGNYVLINDGDFNYDLVIVGGSYHGMNVIFQNNILYNNDTVQITGDGINPNQTVSTGDNHLTNSATIENYGGNNNLPWTSDLDDLVHNISGGATEIDPSFGNLIAGNGGTFHILYVTGNYYDVNAIWQTNVVSDANMAIQLQQSPSSVAAAYYGDSMATQNVSTGGNVLSNDAAIVDVGNTNTYVNGQAYGDTILVQANLVNQDSDHVVQTNPQALVPEVIAFIGHDDTTTTSDTQHQATTALPHDDPMACVLH
ncbi:MAG: hypothetical protein BGN91_16615 [Nitrobacter sp. 62-13]|uniref:hypothetical protein n=1 Tax=Nitrobacter sp. 62-13 TaxID=1895797 RepID=UPI00095E1EE3|nr:hypothetical protein [Nitrobacter sp. 62-13]OJU29935.1 MAG: hypothetical protein BGN91_16615 [Nitrobacter sp. 62-13]